MVAKEVDIAASKPDHRRELETTSRGLESFVSMVVLPLARLIRLIQLWQQLAKCTFNFHLDTGSHSHLVALLADLMRRRLPSIVPGQPCSTGGQLLAIGNYLVLHGISSHAASGQFLEEHTELVTFPSTPRLQHLSLKFSRFHINGASSPEDGFLMTEISLHNSGFGPTCITCSVKGHSPLAK
jgi:hypothetical protein